MKNNSLHRKPVLVFLLVLAMILVGAATASAGVKDHDSKNIITVYDKDGKVISELAHTVTPGDYIITTDNKGYVISRVSGKKAYARSDGKVDLGVKDKAETPRENLGSAVSNLWHRFTSSAGLAGAATGSKPIIGLYCTHSDESYEPTSGVSAKNKGDIYDVAAVLKAGLEKQGYRVVQSQNNHNPHDPMAYTRSRRTVMELMRYKPIALIDVHRDAIPDPKYYQRNIKGEDLAVTRVVVGKQNANRQTNLEFAKKIKGITDAKYPGLVKEIFWGHGNYNQDLGPKTILLEFGTHTVSEKMANRGADLLATALPQAIGGSAAGGAGAGRMAGSSMRSLIFIIIGIVVIGGAFLAMNRSGMEFTKKSGGSTAGFLGRLNRRRHKERGVRRIRSRRRR